MTTEIINEENFNQYFKDVRQNKPEKDDIIAKYSAMAEFVDGGEKRQIISLLMTTEDKMEATAQIMRKLLFACERDALKVPRMMAEDLISGMSTDEVAEKPYKYKVEIFISYCYFTISNTWISNITKLIYFCSMCFSPTITHYPIFFIII